MRKAILTLAAMLFLSASAYAKYFQITDNATGKVYYTKNVVYKSGGAVRFKDANTGNKITLQSTTVTKMNKEQFNQDTCGCGQKPEMKQEIRVNPPNPE
jgi:hypothetical protein